MAIDRLDQLYDALSKDGAQLPKRDIFRKNFLANGDKGYQNRKAFWQALKDDGAQVGNSYEEFRDALGLHGTKKTYKQSAQDVASQKWGPQNLKRPVDYSKPGALVSSMESQEEETEDALMQPVREISKVAKNNQFTPQKDEEGNKVFPVMPKEIARDEELRLKDVLNNGTLERMKQDVEGKLNNTQLNLREQPSGFMDALRYVGQFGNMGAGGVTPIISEDPYDNPDVKNRLATLRFLQNGEALKNAARATQDKGTLGQIGYGIKETATDPGTWDMGQSDLNAFKSLYEAADKFDKGEKLSESEQDLLKAAALYSAYEGEYSGQVGSSVKAGQVTANAIPFMLEMAANPAAGAGRALQKQVVKGGMRKLVKDMTTSIVKKSGRTAAAKQLGKGIAARLGGDILGAAAMTATTGALGVEGNFYDRMQGQTKYGVKDGEIQYVGREDGNTTLKALGKAFADRWTENFSEMVGAYFAPMAGLAGKVAEKGLRTMKLGKVVDLVRGLGSTGVARVLDNALEKTQWNGVFEEYAEEVVGNVINAALVGDMTFDASDTGVFNPKQNLETLYSVALMGGVFSAVRTAGYGYNIVKGNREVAIRDAEARNTLKDWDNVKKTINSSKSDEELLDNITNIVQNTPDVNEKTAILRYAAAKAKLRGILYGEQSARQEQFRDKQAQRPADIQEEGNTVTMTNTQGEVIGQREIKDEEDRKVFVEETKINRSNQDLLDDYARLEKMSQDLKADIEAGNGVTLSDDQMITVRSKVIARFTEDGKPLENVLEDMEVEGTAEYDALQDAIREFDPLAEVYYDAEVEFDIDEDTLTGIIRKDPLKRTAQEQEIASYFAQKAHEAAYPEGELHPEQSFVDGQDLADNLNIGEGDTNSPIGLQEQKVQAEKNLQELLKNEDFAENWKHLQYVSPDEAVMYLDGLIPEQDMNTLIGYFNVMAKYNGFISKTEQKIDQYVNQETSKRTFNGTINGSPSQERMLTIEHNGNTYTLVNGNVSLDSDNRVVNSDDGTGVLVVLNENGDMEVIQSETGMQVIKSIPMEEYANTLRETVGADITEQMGVQPQETQEEQPTAESTEEPTEETQETVEDNTEEVEVQEPEDFDYSKQTDVKSGYDNFLRYNEGDEEMSMELAQSELADAKDSLKNIDKEKVPSGVSMQEKKKYISDRNQRKQEAQNRVDFWNGIIEENKTRKQEAERLAKEEAERIKADEEARRKAEEEERRREELEDKAARDAEIEDAKNLKEKWAKFHEIYDLMGIPDEILDESVPLSAEELVAMSMPRRGLNWEGFERDGVHVRGVKEELGVDYDRKFGKNTSTSAIEPFLAKKGQGKGVQQFIHDVWESQGPGKHFSEEEVRNAFINLLLGATKPSDITYYVVNNRSQLASQIVEEQKREEQRAAYEAAAAEAQAKGLTVDELLEQDELEDNQEITDEPVDVSDNNDNSDNKIQRTDEEVNEIISSMKKNAIEVPTVEISDSTWKDEIDTPIGKVKMGENQKAKLYDKKREQQYGMVIETLSNPDIVLEELDKEPDMYHQRPSSYLFVKTFSKPDGTKYVHFESVTVSQDGMEVSISSHIIRENQLRSKLKSDRLLYKATALDETAIPSAEQPTNTGGSQSSESKDNTKSDKKQEKQGKSLSDEENLTSRKPTDTEEKKWQYDLHYDKSSGRAWITRDDVSGIVPIGDGRFRIEGKSLAELRAILENPANNLGGIMEQVETQLHNAEVGEQLRNNQEPANRLVTKERYDELKKRMREKLLGQANIGIDPEILAIGTEMAVYHIENGARKFAEYARAMIEDLGDVIRPYLKAFYNGARDLPEMEELSKEMTPYDEVSRFDVANFDKTTVDPIATAEQIANEDKVDKQADKVRKEQPKVLDLFSQEDEKSNKPKEEDNSVNVNKQENNEPKKDVSLQGNSAEYANREYELQLLRKDIRAELDGIVNWGDKPEPMSTYKRLAKERGFENLSDTDLQEIIESEVVSFAREISNKEGWSEEDKYKKIVKLYEGQPSLNARDNDRINLQQYSTPVPMAYLMGLFVNPNKTAKSGLEPSAGNGMLTVNLPKEIMHVNDIDEMRLSNLQRQGFNRVTNQDGTLSFGEKQYDVVVTNPPFGNVQPVELDGYTISGLEQLMAINALTSMKDDGRAAIIIGGNTEYNQNGSIKGKDKSFFNYLYSHYNVVDVINLDGKALYSRQGTSYPVRMILINGRKEFNPGVFAPTIQKARAERVNSYDELYKRVNDDILSDNNKSADIHDTESGESRRVDDPGHAGTSAQTGVRNVRDGGRSGEHQLLAEGGQRISGRNESTGTTERAGRLAAEPNGDNSVGRGSSVANGSGEQSSQSDRSTPSQTEGRGETLSERRDNAERPDGGNDQPERLGQRRPGNAQQDEQSQQRGLSTEKVPYKKQSENPFTLNSLMPAEQADEVKKILEDLGDVDQFLVDELGYSSKQELHGALAAEQIDSVAMAIHQMNQGNAFIIGDMTGIGKGRQAAALIRYAVKKGGNPVFVTVKKSLFSDMYRDLRDIGSAELKPFIWCASDKDHSENITDEDGNLIYEWNEDEQDRVRDYVNKHGKLPKEYDYIVTTYDGFKSGTLDYENGQKKARNMKKAPEKATLNGQARRNALETLARNSYVIMDESHNAGGDKSNISKFLQYITVLTKGTTFLSATFAKRPENMPIYALRTAISKAGVEIDELIGAVKRGGATFQEIMSKALTGAGQMIRRERDMTGVTIDWKGIEDEKVIEKQREQYDQIIGLFNEIIDFQRTYIDPIVNNMNDEAADAQGEVNHTPGTRDMGINNTPFASRTYNIVQQVLLSLKAEETAKRAIEHLKAGRKPVIAVANTNEGAAEEATANKGEDMIMPDLSINLLKGLEGTLRIQRKDAFNNKTQDIISWDQLPKEAQDRYHEIEEHIHNASTGLSLSPIDVIKDRLKKAGYKIGELTGRKAEFVYNEDGTVKRVSREETDKKKIAAKFNRGDIDALIINRSAGTGISLHASSKFKDQRQRVMIVAQAQGDVNDEVQMRGRIDRTGQVLRGMYEYVVSQIPSEQRLLMMLKAKLRSLDANTTSSQKSKFNEMNVQDVMNKYGDQILIQYLAEHPDTYSKMADPLKWGERVYDLSAEELVSKASKAEEDGATASKILGRMALLKVKEQEQMLDEIAELYQAEIDRLNEMGENDLEITEMPLRAKTLKKDVWEQGIEPGGKNPFADNTYVEKVSMDVLKKPMKASDVKKAQNGLLNGKTWDEYKQGVIDGAEKWADGKKAETTETITKRAEKKANAEKDRYQKAAKRSQAKNELTDEEIEKNTGYQYDNVYNQEMEKLQPALDAIDKQKQVFLDAVELFSTDGVYAIPSNIYDLGGLTFEPSFGKLIDIKISNNYSTNASTLSFATLDGRRKITIPINGMVKQLNNERRSIFPAINTLTAQVRHNVFGANVSNTLKVLEQNPDNWDRLTSTATRKEGYIITGNLLKALVSTRDQGLGGRLISFTTDTGEVRQGILMSDSFEPAGLTSKTPISSAKEQLRYNGDKIVSADGNITIKQDGWRDWATFILSVPKSKKKGEKYFNDKTLLSLVDGQFEGSSKLRAEFKRDNLDAVLKRLDELGVTVTESVGDNGTRLRTGQPVTGSEIGPEKKQEIINHLRKLAKKLNTPIVFHNDTSDIANNRILNLLKAGKMVGGWYDLRDGSVHFYTPSITSRYDAEKTIWHEVAGHKGMRGLLGEDGYRTFLRKLYLDMSPELEPMHEWIRDHLPEYRFNIYETMDEYFAYEVAEKKADEKFWDKVMMYLKDILIKLGFINTPNITDLKYMLWLSVQNLKDGNPLDSARKNAMLAKLERGGGVIDYKRYFKGASRLRTTFMPNDVNETERYERNLQRAGYVWSEAHHDYMLAFKELMLAISNGRKVPDTYNAYMLENESDSKIKVVEENYQRDFCEALQIAIENCLRKLGGDKKETYADFETYAYKKHGLERNREFFVRDWFEDRRNSTATEGDLDPEALSAYQKALDRIEQDWDDGNIDSEEEKNRLEREALQSAYHEMLNRYETNWNKEKGKLLAEMKRGNIKYDGYLLGLDSFIEDYFDENYEPVDYSGLTDLGGGEYNDEAMIQDVLDMEDKLGTDLVNEFWNRMNALTRFAVETEYNAGLVDKNNRDRVNDMFHFYLPLRRWDADTAQDVWEYMGSKGSNYVGKTIMKAKGRKSRADMPIATAFAMGDNAIIRGARNEVKQAFARFVDKFEKGDNRLVTQMESWIQNMGTDDNPEWVEVYPDIKENATADEVAKAIDAFKVKMEALRKEKKAMKLKDKGHIEYRFAPKSSFKEHCVEVYIGGEKHVYVVNGNPRAAQAINGLLKSESLLGNKWNFVKQVMSKAYTSWAPTFAARNMARDAEYASAMLNVKEGWDYTKEFMKNYSSLLVGGKTKIPTPIMFSLFSKYRKGTLDEGNKIERYFKEFVENGGVTGYVDAANPEKWRKKILKSFEGKDWTEKLFKCTGEAVEHFNEAIENTARFATFITSREQGRTAMRSAYDAKEVSVNFNRKGSGYKAAGFKYADGNYTKNAWWAGWTAQFLRETQFFYNASLQGLANTTKNAIRHPGKFIPYVAAGPFIAGAMIPMFNAFIHAWIDDDDDDVSENPYADQAEYTRRQNLCLYIGKGNFITIPLAIELRAFYGLGDIIAGYLYDEKLQSVDKNIAEDAVSAMSNFSPVDFTSESGIGELIGAKGVVGQAINALTPGPVSGIVNVITNKSWTGRPIQKETPFNKLDPAYTKAYEGTNEWIIAVSKWWHELFGGDDVRRAGKKEGSKNKEFFGEVGPGDIEYLLGQYLGEAGRVMSTTTNIKSIVKGETKFNARMLPVVKAFWNQSDERTQFYRAKAKYYKYLDTFEEVKHEESEYKKKKDDPTAYLDNLNFEKETRYKAYQIYKKNYKKELDKLRKEEQAANDPTEKKEKRREQNVLIESFINTVEAMEWAVDENNKAKKK